MTRQSEQAAPEDPASPEATSSEPITEPWGVGRPTYYQSDEVAADYDRRYATGIARWKHLRKQRLIKKWLERSSSVLEVASGPGRFPEAVAGRFGVALDLSRAMLRQYRKTCPDRNLVTGDASRLPFEDDSFETVICIRYLAHLRGEFRAQVLAELVRVSSKAVIIDGRHLYNLRFFSRWVRRRLGLAHADKLRHTFGEFRREMEGAGLEVVETRSIAWGLSARFLLRARKVVSR